MTHKIQKNLYRYFGIRFFIQICLYTVVLFVLAGVSYAICSSRTWYGDEWLYPIIHFLHAVWEVLFLILLLIGVVIIASKNMMKVARNMTDITEAVRHIYTEKDYEISLPDYLNDVEYQLREIGYDVKINQKAAQEALQRKNDLIMYMAHDLKTPLTSVIGYLNLLNDEKEISEELREKYMGIATKKALRLEELINEFFEIARFNFSTMILEESNVNMSVMLEQMLFEFEPLFREKKLKYTYHSEKDVQVYCDVEKMERVFDNLLKNIVNYSYEQTEIEITLNKKGDSGMCLLMKNHGKTIPQEKLNRLFEQFYRMDGSRGTKTGGSGLGLAVVKEIVEMHQGTVSCESANEEICFCICIG